MTERPRSRQTIVVGAVTVAAMLLVAAIFLLKTSPWNDPQPHFHKKATHSYSAR